jgi:cytochrome b pre-mRNA-processing protein 3
MLKALRRNAKTRKQAKRLCIAVMVQARAPVFFTALHISDTMDGRFDLLALHAWLMLDRVRAEPVLAQALIDELFLHFDEALRQIGTGDMGMNRRLKTMAGAFYGRLQAYREAVDAQTLTDAILRNLYRGAEDRVREAQIMATYVLNTRSHLARSRPSDGELDFGPLPTM